MTLRAVEDEPPPASPTPPRRMRRAAVARYLGISVTMVRELENQGKLLAVKEEWRCFFDRGEVERFAQTYRPKRRASILRALEDPALSGPKSSQVFRALELGKTLTQIVIELEIPPELVRRAWKQWKFGFEAWERERERIRALAAERETQREHDRANRRREQIELNARAQKSGQTGFAAAQARLRDAAEAAPPPPRASDAAGGEPR